MRIGAKVSFVTWPDHARFQSASTTEASFSAPVASRSCAAKYAPPEASAASSWASRDPGSGASSANGTVNGARSAGCRETQPSRPGRAPWPAQTTSPELVSSSSIAGV